MISCQKETITLGTGVSETFYLDNAGASMRILVNGNTQSKTFLIMVHGGPGVGSFAYKTDYISQHIADKYAIVYWDQRNAGSSQGNANSNHLNLSQMTEDLKKVVQLIKSRYGENASVFILGHSFGGLLVTSFMTTGNYQSMVKGWIFVDGSQNYPWNDTLTRQMLLTTGQQQIALNKHTSDWQHIVNYCIAHTGNFTFSESEQLAAYATDAETYFDGIQDYDYITVTKNMLIQEKLPFTSILINYFLAGNESFTKALATASFSQELYKITAPTLVLFGQYDFICPKELGYEVMNRISSTGKKMVISPISGHNLMFQDPELYCTEVNQFIAQNR